MVTLCCVQLALHTTAAPDFTMESGAIVVPIRICAHARPTGDVGWNVKETPSVVGVHVRLGL